MKKYKIGITFNLELTNTDIWANGVNQNLIFLYELFKRSELVEDVMLVSWGVTNETNLPECLSLDGLELKCAYVNDVIDELDVLIEGALSIEQYLQERMHAHGGKIVCYKMGPDYITDIEAFISNRDTIKVFNGTKFDSLWLIPQNENTCKSYFSIMHRCEGRVVPAIWAPTFCDMWIKNRNLDFGYKPNFEKKSRRISTFEPNISIFKNSFTPILICEQAYRTAPEKIEHVYITNAWDKREHPTFFNFVGRTDVVRDGILTVEARFPMPEFLTFHTDIVLSHQWENGLNYAYNDALYGGYPFIHNSKLLPKGVGYYYDQFDAFDGANVLLDVIDNHDKHHEEYVKRANDYLESLLPTNPVNIAIYEAELKRLFEE